MKIKTPFGIIITTYVIITVLSLIWTSYISFNAPESISIGIPFAFIGVLGLGLFAVSLLFTLIFIKYLRAIWKITIPVFIATSIIPIHFLTNSLENRPIDIPKPGIIPVSTQLYEELAMKLIYTLETEEIDSNRLTMSLNKIDSFELDTIIFSENQKQFFSILIGKSTSPELKFSSFYRVGILKGNSYEIRNPIGNIWSTSFSTTQLLKNELRQYYFKKYSINDKSKKKSIWNDKYIFNNK